MPPAHFFPHDSGTYIVAMNAAQVTDTSHNAVPAGTIGSFSLTFPTLAPKPDLMGTFKSVTPTSLAGGSKGSATITVRNGGTLALAATKVTITLYASTASDGSHSGPAIGTFSGIIKLAARASMNVPIAFTAPKNLADANYHIVAVLDSAQQSQRTQRSQQHHRQHANCAHRPAGGRSESRGSSVASAG